MNHLVLGAYSGAVLGLCLFLRGLQLFARKRSRGHVQNISVSAATSGPATVSGAASGPRILTAPITGRQCFVYRTSIFQRESSSQEWKNVAEETGHLTFTLEDPTGKVSVEPCGAELDLRQCLSEEYAPASNPASDRAIPEHVISFLVRNGVAADRPTRLEECCLRPAAPVFITGTLVENSNATNIESAGPAAIEGANGVARRNQSEPATNRNLPALAPGPEVIRLASGIAPSTTLQMTQQAKIAAALSRAGLAKTDPWGGAEPSVPDLPSVMVPEKTHSDPGSAVSSTSAVDSPTSNSPQRESAQDPAPVPRFTMTKGAEGSAFVISNHEPVLPMALGWQSISLVITGTSLTALGIGAILLGHLRWVR